MSRYPSCYAYVGYRLNLMTYMQPSNSIVNRAGLTDLTGV